MRYPKRHIAGSEFPAGPDRFPEIKHDGYRLIVQREGKRVRLLTRRGYDWSDRYPLITEAALRLRKQSFVIDGEAVVLGPDGISDFDGLHSGRCNEEVRLYAFDLLMDDGVDMRDETLQIRKLWLGKLLKCRGDSILLNDHEAAAIGPRLFEQACKMGHGGDRFEASGPHLQSRPIVALGQSQKPQVVCHGSRQGHGASRAEDHLGGWAFAASWSFARTTNAPICRRSVAIGGRTMFG